MASIIRKQVLSAMTLVTVMHIDYPGFIEAIGEISSTFRDRIKHQVGAAPRSKRHSNMDSGTIPSACARIAWCQHFFVMIGKPFTGKRAKRFDKLQIVVGGGDRDMSEVGCQEGELGIQVHAFAIPANQSVYRESMTKIMHPWQLAL
jgi:hypothetical protein